MIALVWYKNFWDVAGLVVLAIIAYDLFVKD